MTQPAEQGNTVANTGNCASASTTTTAPTELQLKIQDCTPKIYNVTMSSTSTVAELKQSIVKFVNTAVGQQRLKFNDQILEDAKTLQSCGIKTGATIHFSLHKRR